MEQQLNKVDLSIIRYANCWEDADVLVEALNVQKSSRVISIASAGDNSFSLLLNEPELVVAVDISKPQLYLVELKKLAIIHLTREEYMAFAGFKENKEKRSVFYQSIKSELTPEAATYWDKHIKSIERGVIHSGKFENYFRIFSRFVLPLCHSKKTIRHLTEVKPIEAQREFYEKTWNNRRWKFMTRIFFGKVLMGKLGRDPQFLKHVNFSVGEYIYRTTGEHLTSLTIQNNCYNDYILTGKFSQNLPHYVREGNYERIRMNIQRLEILEGYIEDACQKYGHFTHYNLSNIFEYMDEETFVKVAQQIVQSAEKGARLAYWNLMVERRISIVLKDQVNALTDLSEQLSATDKCFFYRRFLIDQKNLE